MGLPSQPWRQSGRLDEFWSECASQHTHAPPAQENLLRQFDVAPGFLDDWAAEVVPALGCIGMYFYSGTRRNYFGYSLGCCISDTAGALGGLAMIQLTLWGRVNLRPAAYITVPKSNINIGGPYRSSIGLWVFILLYYQHKSKRDSPNPNSKFGHAKGLAIFARALHLHCSRIGHQGSYLLRSKGDQCRTQGASGSRPYRFQPSTS